MSNIDLNLHDFIQINDIQNIVNEARENDTDIEEKIIKNQNLDNYDFSNINFSDTIFEH